MRHKCTPKPKRTRGLDKLIPRPVRSMRRFSDLARSAPTSSTFEIAKLISVLLFDALSEIHVLRQIAAVRRRECKMENINGKSRASFPWTLSCVTMGLAASVSLCFAQGDRDASRELQHVQEVQRLLGPCDSL